MESANVKLQNIFHRRNNITCSTYLNAEELQHYIPLYPRNIVCFRYSITNTLHKGDKKDNNSNNNNNNSSNNNNKAIITCISHRFFHRKSLIFW